MLQDQWIFTEKEYLHTPFVALNGMEKDLQIRKDAIALIFHIGFTLGAPQTTIAIASIYFHRFFMRESLANFPVFVSALTF